MCRLAAALRAEREQEEKEGGKLGEVVKRRENVERKEKQYEAFLEDGKNHHPARFEPLGGSYEEFGSKVKRRVWPHQEQQWTKELGMEVSTALRYNSSVPQYYSTLTTRTSWHRPRMLLYNKGTGPLNSNMSFDGTFRPHRNRARRQ